MKDAAFSDGIFSNIVVLRNQAPHSDRQNTDLLLHYLLSYLQRNRQISRRMDTHGIIVVERFATFHYY